MAIRRAAAKKPAAKSKATAKSKIPVNHIALVVDRSGSMRSIMKTVVKVFNQQLETIKKNAKKDDQETFVSFYTFDHHVDKPLYFERQATAVKPLKKIELGGSTALLDAVGTAITAFEKVKNAKAEHHSFLIITLTDGEENASKKYKKTLPRMIKQAQATGRWSLAFLAPKTGVAQLKKFGIPAGNIQDWAATSKGAQAAGETLRRGLTTFFDARRGGGKAVTGFFSADLSKVDAKSVSDQLVEVGADFQKWPVTSGAIIREFVDKQLGGKGKYEPGKGYYELTKPELVQAGKEIAIKNLKTGEIFTGMGARSLLGFPDGSAFKVKPGQMGDFAVYVMSTSLNRVLVAGTTLLYRS
jgi:uncharacterized protein YegL